MLAPSLLLDGGKPVVYAFSLPAAGATWQQHLSVCGMALAHNTWHVSICQWLVLRLTKTKCLGSVSRV